VLFALTTGAKTYYLAAAYVYLLAAGAVAIDGWLHARSGRLRNLMLATAVTTAVALPAVLPVLPPAATACRPLGPLSGRRHLGHLDPGTPPQRARAGGRSGSVAHGRNSRLAWRMRVRWRRSRLVRATVPIVSPVRVISQVAMYAVWS
jgi:hypothetical protein